MKRLKSSAWWYAAFFGCVSVSGCMGLFIGDPHPYAYVTRMGNADTIGKWTMAQTDGLRIYDGLCALSERMGSSKDRGEVDKAMVWFQNVVEKVEDWPAGRVLPTESGCQVTTSILVQRIFSDAAFDAYSDPVREELLRRLRPDTKHARWIGDWEQSVADLKKWRQEGRDVGAGRPLEPLNAPSAKD
jgi:hypothetical protein